MTYLNEEAKSELKRLLKQHHSARAGAILEFKIICGEKWLEYPAYKEAALELLQFMQLHKIKETSLEKLEEMAGGLPDRRDELRKERLEKKKTAAIRKGEA